MGEEESRLLLWEAASVRAPIDRALLFAARQGLETAAEAPVNVRDRAVLELQASLFGDTMAARLSCSECGETLEATLSAATLSAPVSAGDGLRAPTSRELVEALGRDRAAARRLLAARATGQDDVTDAEADAIEAELEAAGAPGDIRIVFSCPACGADGSAGLDPGEWLWRQLDAAASGIMAEVAALASAYGWSEAEALALSPFRRARYLELAGGDG